MELSVSSETTASHGYKLSWPESSHPDELDEEFDTFPTSRSHDAVRMRYDRLKTVADRIQHQDLLFVLFSLCEVVIFYATPFRVVVLVTGLYNLRHPR
ncbi:putative phosphoribosyltransferase [Medicago truncatula]|uniref:Plant phosphoribosyltransferase carboxy-terminal protein n=1 Tax=Medicago truncatula TaxID=3880 RepID=G7JDC5_MEDTR|nr:plant phosphoribosyltransferase carboxy-terminal protein [Medicago truncatula]RHN59200.1 putative phosphoribosyltransferase [Medicago truncatula]